MNPIRPTVLPSRRSRPAIAAACVALILLSLPGSAAGRSAASAASAAPRDTFAWVAPTKAPPAVNRPHAGRHVAVRFTLGHDEGLDILVPGWPRAQRVNCTTGEPIKGTLWRTHPYGAEGLEYDADSGTYTYVWEVRPEWGNGALRCRQFLLNVTGRGIQELSFRFRSAPASEPPPGLGCADIVDGDGSYVSKDAQGDPLPEPKVSFFYELAAPSCAPHAGTVTKYRLFVLPADTDGHPTSWLPIASQIVDGDGVAQILTFDIDIDITDEPAPPAVCVYGDVRRGDAIVESAPQPPYGCFDFQLDGSHSGRSGWD